MSACKVIFEGGPPVPDFWNRDVPVSAAPSSVENEKEVNMIATEAKDKIDAASRACDEAHKAWSDAASALAGTVSVNGYGIFHDRDEFRRKLESARANINDALNALNGVDWPADADYDQL